MQQAIGRGDGMGHEGITNQPMYDAISLDVIRRRDVARYTGVPSTKSKVRKSRRDITVWALAGLLLMVSGFGMLAYQGIRYALQVQSDAALSTAESTKITIPISPLLGITAMFAGYVLIVREKD